MGLDSTRPAFEQLTEACHRRKLPVEAWRSEEHLATEERGERLKFFDINHQKSPTLAQITVQLCDNKDNPDSRVHIVQWIADGIKAENDQFVLNLIYDCFVLINRPRSRLLFVLKTLSDKPTIRQQLKVKRMQAHLRKEIKDFFQTSSSFLPSLEELDLKPLRYESIDTPLEEFVEPEDLVDGNLEGADVIEEDDEAEDLSIVPESVILPLPSNIVSAKDRPALESLISVERELRKGQANDALEGLRIGLANKSLLLLTDVNQSTSTKQSTRAWASVRNTQSQILFHARGYQRAWGALTSVGTPEDLLVYRKLEEKDLVVVKDITMAKRFGQGSETLAWFWRIGPSKDSLTGEWMEECECN